MKFKFLVTFLTILSASYANAAEYHIDVPHSNVAFSIQHLLISTVHGNFKNFSGQIEYDENKPKAIQINGSIDATSINTNNEKRDKHLKSKDFFDVEKFPNITFKSIGLKKFKKNKGILLGELTMHGVTQKIELDFVIVGTTSDTYGNDKAVFTANGAINRKDYGISWGDTLDNGGAVVGDTVHLSLNIEANKVKKQDTKKASVKK